MKEDYLCRLNKKYVIFIYFHHKYLPFLFDNQALKYYNVGYINMYIFCTGIIFFQ